MLIRYYGAARAATGRDEETVDLAAPTLSSLLQDLVARHPDGSPTLESVIRRSSFLLNETALRDHGRVLAADDVVDILPPFAGG